MQGLRNEIIESQKIRSDLMKWKLLIVASLGAVGLGISKSENSHHIIFLCFIPLVCIYVDLLCYHLSLRIRIIGRLLSIQLPAKPDDKYEISYEKFMKKYHVPFKLETAALIWSSIALSVLIFILSVLNHVHILNLKITFLSSLALYACSIVGVVVPLLIFKYFKKQASMIDTNINDFEKKTDDKSSGICV